MLSERYVDKLADILISETDWRPHPTVADRDTWGGVRSSVREAHLKRGEEALNFGWPVAPATLFLDYQRTGNRSRYQTQVRDARRNALCDLVMAECLEGTGRFIDAIVDGIWCTCEESFWGVPAHLGRQKAGVGLPDVDDPIVDLFAAEASALLAWTVYLLNEPLNAVSPLIVKRVKREIDRRILTPLENRHFGWMGSNEKGRRPNNWNPWIVSNWLTSALVVEDDPDRRVAHVEKALETVDRFLDPYPADGGCDEGPGYWNRAGGAVFDCLEILHSATDGQIDVWDDPLIVNIGRFIYHTHIHDRYFVNFADAAARVNISPPVVFGYGQRIGDEDMMALGAWGAREQSVAQMGLSDSLGRDLRGLQVLDDLLACKPRQPKPRDAWLPDIQVMVARDEDGTESGFFVAAKGGHNEESHNHNDVGNFVVYVDGKPLIVDIGVEDYTARTFGPHRYEIWTMRSSFHSVPTINGMEQAPGAQFAANDVMYQMDDAVAELAMDLAGAYPEEAKVQSWRRAIRVDRGEGVTVVDRYALDAVTGDLTMNLVTPSEVTVKDGELDLVGVSLDVDRKSADGKVVFDGDVFEVMLEDYPLAEVSFKRGNPWGERLTRIVLKVKEPETQGEWTIWVVR